MVNRKSAPSISELDTISVVDPTVSFLDNNVEVSFFNLGTQDVVHVEFVFKTGLSNHDNIIIPTAISDLIGVASKTQPSGKIIEKIDYYGAYLETSINMDIATVSVYSLSEHVNQVLEIVKNALVETLFDEKDVNIFLSNAAQKLKNDLERVEFHCLREFNRLIFADHPYGNIVDFTDFENVNSAKLKKHYDSFFNAGNLSIIVSGCFNGEKIFQSLNSLFGKWGKIPSQKKVLKLSSSNPEKKYFSKKGAVQSAIRIGKIIPVEYGSRDYFILKMVNTVLGGYFGSRLMSNLREDKGITYGVNSSLINYDCASFLVIASTVKAESTDLALKEIYYELEKLCSEPISKQELKTVKNYMSGSLMRAIDGTFLIAEQYKLLNHKGKTMTHLVDFYQTIEQVNSDEILSISSKFLSPTTFSEVVVGNKSNN